MTFNGDPCTPDRVTPSSYPPLTGAPGLLVPLLFAGFLGDGGEGAGTFQGAACDRGGAAGALPRHALQTPGHRGGAEETPALLVTHRHLAERGHVSITKSKFLTLDIR